MMFPMSPMPADVDGTSIFFDCAVVIGLVAIGAFGVMRIRKRIWGDDSGVEAHPDGFTLGELRRLRQNGQLTAEEFEKARAMIVAATQRRAESTAKPKKPGSAA
ncbi:MAG: SHOCT domain-containing protein [Tepidisphaeraceae bacterium]|jgi:hypothetical protein